MVTPESGQWSWKWCALAILPILFLSLLPQIQFWIDRGSQWQGTYATLNADEFLYSGYLNALIDQRPRRNDPFNGIDDRPESPLPETAFSIQVVPAVVLSALARMFGLSASTVFIALTAIAGVAAAFSIFWLLFSISGDHKLSASGTLFVLVVGTLCAGQGIFGVLLKLDIVALGFPFLRRYQPAASFFLFFIFCTLVWRALTVADSRHARLSALFAGVCLGLLVFCYIYLWTTALAWLILVVLFCAVLQPRKHRRRALEMLAISVGFFGVALIPYASLLARRSQTLDELQTLITTRRLDLFRLPELVGFGVLSILIIGLVRGRISKNDPRAIAIAAFSLIPFAVFNEQIFFGKSMQPFHFEVFIANYAVLVSVVVLASFIRFSSRLHVWIAIGCILLGAVEVQLTRAFSSADISRDEMVPALRRLKELSNEYPPGNRPLVFSPHFELNRTLPTWAPQGTLLAIGAIDFGGASHQERKEFLYTHLYYSGASVDRLRDLFTGLPDQLAFSYYVRYAIFGHERVRPLYSLDFQPITHDEIEKELIAYATFANSFSREQALKRPLTYVVALADGQFDFSRIDLWYERDDGETVGAYTLYHLTLRT